VTASGTAGMAVLISNPANVTWVAGKHVTFLDLSPSPSSGTAGKSVTISARLIDISAQPNATVTGVQVHFSLGGVSCNGVTNAQGLASCSLIPPTGQLTLSASFAGSALYTAASAAERFSLVSAVGAPGAPTITSAVAGDAQIVVSFSPPSSDGGSAITSYVVTCTPTTAGSAVTATGAATPITVLGVTNGVTYTCTVSAVNSSGGGPASAPSNPVRPQSGREAIPIPALNHWNTLTLGLVLLLLTIAALRRIRPGRDR